MCGPGASILTHTRTHMEKKGELAGELHMPTYSICIYIYI